MDYGDLKSGIEYTLRFDFYEKELTVVGQQSGTTCNLPYISQALSIIDINLLKNRIKQWANNKQEFEPFITSSIDLLKAGLDCPFESFNNTIESEFGENGVFCQPKTYFYPASHDALF